MTMNLVVRRDVVQKKGVGPGSPLAQRFGALKGLTIGITTPGAAGDTYTRWMLKQAGLDPVKDVNIVQIGTPDALQAAMGQGRVDAFMLSAPTPERLERDGVGLILIKNSAGDTPEFRQFLHTVVATRRGYAERNPEAVQRVTRAIARGANVLLDQTEEGKKTLQKTFPRIPPEVLSLSVDNMKPGFLRNGRMSEEHWKNLSQVFQDVGITKGPLETREGKLWTNRYLPSF
ncbi:MAG: ABC transporter substrate-binding protein [Armatimonadetes bacterium]|nr:ABC transporter substrate-binding protein [Armatimonadota bacterium]